MFSSKQIAKISVFPPNTLTPLHMLTKIKELQGKGYDIQSQFRNKIIRNLSSTSISKRSGKEPFGSSVQQINKKEELLEKIKASREIRTNKKETSPQSSMKSKKEKGQLSLKHFNKISRMTNGNQNGEVRPVCGFNGEKTRHDSGKKFLDMNCINLKNLK